MDDTLDLRKIRRCDGYWYLATPYSKYPEGMDRAFQEASAVAGWLLKKKIHTFCPIAHSHPISLYGGIPPEAHDVWPPAAKPFMVAASGLIVCMLAGWRESVPDRLQPISPPARDARRQRIKNLDEIGVFMPPS